MTPDQLLRENHIYLPEATAGRHYAVCPQCSHARERSHQKLKCLGVTINGASASWGCNHCGWTGGERFEKANGHDRTITTYDYTDETGSLLFQKVRTPDKKFWQRRPDGKGGWINGLSDTKKVLYRLPELIEAIANDHTVLVVEGEKDVDRLRAVGVPATCNPDGAAKPGQRAKWRPEFSEVLRGARIVVVPDHDEFGYAHADAIADETTGIAQSVRILRLADHWPECPKGGDVSDWLAAGHSREDLDALIATAPEWSGGQDYAPEREGRDGNSEWKPSETVDAPADEEPHPLPFINMSEWDSDPIPERKWAIRDRVPLHQAGLFSGEGGTGKSIIELMKNVAHVTAKDWLGSMPEPGPAIYVAAEDDRDEIHIRLAAIAKHHGATFKELTDGGLHILCLLGQDATLCAGGGKSGKIETTALYRQIYEAAGDIKPKNISIDTLSRAFAGSEIDRVQVYAFAMHMQALAMVADGSVTVLSHPSLAGIASGSGISGSTAWHGAFRFRQYLKGVKQAEGEQPDSDVRELEFKKNQYGPTGENIVLRYQHGLFLPEAGVSSLDKIVRQQAAEETFLAILSRFNQQGRNVGPNPGKTYAPTLFVQDSAAKGMTTRDLSGAMDRLLNADKIHIEFEGPPSRRRSRLVAGASPK